jgi:D-2-hydroxyglutarate dehydrogenase
MDVARIARRSAGLGITSWWTRCRDCSRKPRRLLFAPSRNFHGCISFGRRRITTEPGTSELESTFSSVTIDDLAYFRNALLQRSAGRMVLSDRRDFDALRTRAHSPVGSTLAAIGSNMAGVLFDPQMLDVHNTDWTKRWKGNSRVMLQPATVSQVSSIVRYCADRKLALVPQGGRTGLVGGGVPISTEILLNTARLNKIEYFDAGSGILQCQAGCILSDLQDHAARHGHVVPVDFGAAGVCHIGGNVSTNAGGVYFFRYGGLAANVTGLQVVTGTGAVLDLHYDSFESIGDEADNLPTKFPESLRHAPSSPRTTTLKDNTGYKLHQLFIGAEGTLGVITGVQLRCPLALPSKQTAILACETWEKVLLLRDEALDILGETLACCEIMDESIVQLVSDTHPSVRIPFSHGQRSNSCAKFFVLLETHGSDSSHDASKLTRLVQVSTDSGFIVDGVVAQDMSQARQFWMLRESCNPAAAASGYTFKYDLSLPAEVWEEWASSLKARLSSQYTGDCTVVVTQWGHLMDGNVHCNVTTLGRYDREDQLHKVLEPFIFESTVAIGGSISAEHGLGICKNQYLSSVHSPVVLRAMRDLKALFDPEGILNPNKLLPLAYT